MKTGTDIQIQWKQEEYDQNLIKSDSSYICYTPARKTLRRTTYPPFLDDSPLLRIPLTLKRLFHPSIS